MRKGQAVSKPKTMPSERQSDVEFHNRHVDMHDNRAGVDPDLAAALSRQQDAQLQDYLAGLKAQHGGA